MLYTHQYLFTHYGKAGCVPLMLVHLVHALTKVPNSMNVYKPHRAIVFKNCWLAIYEQHTTNSTVIARASLFTKQALVKTII